MTFRFAALALAAALACVAPTAAAVQDAPSPAPAPAPEPAECSNLNKCRKPESKEKKDCPGCSRRKINADDAFCTTCAKKEDVCRLCGLPKKGSGPRAPKDQADAFKAASDSITAQDMKDFLTTFASDGFQGRDTGSEGIKKARAFLTDHLKKAGAKPLRGDSYELPWNNCANMGTLFEGSDPKLKNEYVIVGSHMDHIGMRGGGGGDTISNGADDNGSGSTTNKEICEALFKNGIRTKRSIVNLWFTAEEKGLLGSKGFVQSPPIPMNQVVAMLNVDMVGRNPEQAASLWGVGSSPAFSSVVDKAARLFPGAKVNKIMEKGELFHRSDQANFWNAGVPVMFISTGLHADYHKVTDSPDKISYDRMAQIGRYMLTILVELANSDTRPAKTPGY